MKVIIRNTPTGYVVGQYAKVITKNGDEISVFEPNEMTADVTPTAISVTGEHGVRVHKLWPKADRVVSSTNGKDSTQIADAAWINTDSHGISYISCYAQDRPSEFTSIDI